MARRRRRRGTPGEKLGATERAASRACSSVDRDLAPAEHSEALLGGDRAEGGLDEVGVLGVSRQEGDPRCVRAGLGQLRPARPPGTARAAAGRGCPRRRRSRGRRRTRHGGAGSRGRAGRGRPPRGSGRPRAGRRSPTPQASCSNAGSYRPRPGRAPPRRFAVVLAIVLASGARPRRGASRATIRTAAGASPARHAALGGPRVALRGKAGRTRDNTGPETQSLHAATVALVLDAAGRSAGASGRRPR